MSECGEGIKIILWAIVVVVLAILITPKDDELYP